MTRPPTAPDYLDEGEFEPVDDLDDISDGLPENTGWYFVERYLNGEVEVHLHLSLRANELEPANLCISFYRSTGQRQKPTEDLYSWGEEFHPDFVQASGTHVERRWDQTSVLIGVVEICHASEGDEARSTLVPALVRLQILDECAAFDGDTLKGPRASFLRAVGNLRIPPLRTDKDWERVMFPGCLPIRKNKLPDKVVQGTPGIVRNITHDEAPGGVEGSRFVVDDRVPLIQQVRLEDNGILVRFKESPEFSVESFEMLFCPRDLQSGIDEASSHGL